MILITSPDCYIEPAEPRNTTLFLAGGISGTLDWQAEVVDALKNTSITIFNPRRVGPFDLTNEKESDQQITWEYNHLNIADYILFWFPKETLCPIALFELGDFWRKSCIIGTDPQYNRRYDIVKQMSLRNPHYCIFDSLGAVINNTIQITKNDHERLLK